MSSARILFPDFRDEQSDSRYPFVDTATLLSDDGTTSILRDTFIDAVFYVINGQPPLYISAVTVEPQNVILNFSDATGDIVATAAFAPNPIQISETGALDVVDLYGRPAGAIVADVDKLTAFTGWNLGTYTFAPEATPFVDSVVIPAQEPGVRGLLTSDGTLLTRDVWLVGDAGVVLRYDGVVNNEQIIRVDIVGVPLFNRFVCSPFNRFDAKNFVRTINNCPPDEYGNFTITASGAGASDTVLRVSNKNGIIFFDAIGKKVV